MVSSEFGELDNDNDVSDESTDIDEALDNMSLDELRDLQDSLTDTQDITESYEGTEQLEDLGTTSQETDYSYRWDGGATHNVEWDNDVEDPSVYSLKLSKHR